MKKTIVIIQKNADLKEQVVKQFSLEDLYKKCKFRNTNHFDIRYTWQVGNSGFVSIYGKDNGRAGSENKFDLPPPLDNSLFFGAMALVFHKNKKPKNSEIKDFKVKDWEKVYEKLMGGFEDLGEEDSTESEEEIPVEHLSKQGYSKEDGFIVEDSDPILVESGDSDDEVDFKEETGTDDELDDSADLEEEDDEAYGSEDMELMSEDEDNDYEDEEDDYDDEADNDETTSELDEEEYSY